jgi:hypothetical protein
LKPEWWGSPLEERKPLTRNDDDDDDDNNNNNTLAYIFSPLFSSHIFSSSILLYTFISIEQREEEKGIQHVCVQFMFRIFQGPELSKEVTKLQIPNQMASTLASYLVQIPARRPAVLTETFCSFSQSFRINSGIVS